MNIPDYLTLWELARHRRRSPMDYRVLQSYQASLLIEYMRGFGIKLEGKRILDLGSGIGGYSIEMARLGANVVSLDLVKPSYPLKENHAAVVASALAIPLQSESVDLVFCASLIEHVSNPAGLLAEIERVLKRSGHCYLSFPPFYSPLGGHEFSPFHYLGERLAIRLTHRRARLPEWVGRIYEVSPNPDSFSETYQGWGLFKMTIGKARQLITSAELSTLNISARYLPVSLIRWPILGEVLTWHAQFLLEKPSQRDPSESHALSMLGSPDPSQLAHRH